MIANYHTHTWRCNHAQPGERAYIERAIEGGYQILGFSDHSPYPFPKDHDSWFRMDVDQLEGYVTTLRALQKEYADDIEIHIGLEAEYYPDYFDALQDLLKTYEIEYLLLGQHYLYNEIDAPYNGAKTYSKKRLKDYCDQVIAAMETGFYTYFAHPDLIHFKGSKKVYQEELYRVCLRAKELDIPLEINFLGLMEKRNYPAGKFWEIAGQVGNDVILGCDAHQAKYVYAPDAEEIAKKKFIDKYGLHLIDRIPSLRKPYL